MEKGRIIKSLGGLYTVQTDGGELLVCRARGIFRKEGVSPCVGDLVRAERIADTAAAAREEVFGYVMEILPRKNHLVRPPLANLDQLLLVASVTEPQPNLLVLDKMLAICEKKEIEPLLVITKPDLGDAAPLREIYEKAGIRVFVVNNRTGDGVPAVRQALCGKLSAFTGNTGVGKSSLLNRMELSLTLETGQISKKLGRGRHTTRHVELYELPEGGFIADTPGFSAIDMQRFEIILKGELQYCFREFAPYRENCRFTGCSHRVEKGCAVLEALQKNEIAHSRHESYKAMYEEASQIKEWEVEP